MQAAFPYLAGYQDAQWWPSGMSLEPQRSISDVETIVPTLRGRWNAVVNFALHGEAATLQWQAYLAQMEGRLGAVDVPCFSRFRPKDLTGQMVPFCLPELGPLAPSSTVTRATLAADAALRATQISITLGETLGLEAGHFFSLGARLYRVRTVDSASSTAQTLTIQPPIRTARSTGFKVEIERPICRMRMVSEKEGVFDQSKADLPQVQVTYEEISV